jgi:hypothetical protein
MVHAAFSTCRVRKVLWLPVLLLLSLEVLAQPIGPIAPSPNIPGTGPPLIIVAPCKPIEAGSLPTRIHVKCEKALDNRFGYFFVATGDDARFAARALSVIEAAQLGDKFLTIQFDARFTLQSSAGCPFGEVCRPLQAVTMVETPIATPGRCVFDSRRVGCPAYCAATDDLNCPGFCTRHPGNQGCGSVCARQPDSRQCTDFCAANPTDVLCGEHACGTDPFGATCRRFCAAAPQNLTCSGIKEECSIALVQLPGCQCVVSPNIPACQ